jgi:hypothetical protein
MDGNCIYNLIFPNGKKYVGQTNDFKKRMPNHKKKAEFLTTPVYNAIRKYGWNNIQAEILVYCNPEDADTLERLYITKFKTLDHKYGYNVDSGGVLNKQHSSSTRKKISQANKNKSSQIFKTRAKKICAYTLDGNFVAIYESASEAARIYGVSPNVIARAARGGRKTSCGFVWKWFDN